MNDTRRRRIVHAAMPVVLVLAAAGLVVYGAAFHSRQVLMDREVRLPDALMGGRGAFSPPGGFGRMVESIILEESEPELIREVTFGGVTRLDTGETKRTYTGQPPSLCPT